MMRRNWIVIAALLLAASAMFTTTLATGTMAQYAASATGTAAANVAKWDVGFSKHPTANAATTPSGAYLNSTARPGVATSWEFKIKNYGETAAVVTLKLYYIRNDNVDFAKAGGKYTTASSNSNYPSVQDTINAANSGIKSVSLTPNANIKELGSYKYLFAPGAEGTFTITPKATSGAPAISSNAATNVNNCIRRYKVFFDAEQVD